MAQKIKRLEAHVANQIAAGEVVQRPASLVKELLENAVDAGATNIALHIKEGGKLQVQVIDNGQGMSEQDALLCFERHATSKLNSAADLFNINTKGFRGEALASIAAIARVVLKTKTHKSQCGTLVKIEAGDIVEHQSVVVANGSSFTVNNLFFNIPARRSFLKSKQVEQRHITDEFHRIALVHPDISFSYHADEAPLFVLPAATFSQRIVQIFGKKIQDKLVPVKEETPQLSISGFVLKPVAAKKSKGTQYFFVNQRFIKSTSLHFAVVNAFDGLIPQGVHPGYFLQITVPAHEIDINIHPTKTEIKFEDEHTLFAILRASIKHALGQFNVAPILDFNRDPNLDPSYQDHKKPLVPPQIVVDASFNPFENQEVLPTSKTKTPNHSEPFGGNGYLKKAPHWESLYAGIKEAPLNYTISKAASTYIEQEPTQESLFEHVQDEGLKARCFQLAKKYILSPTKSGMVVIHQSRAHQRILYEGFLNNFTHAVAGSQQLLFPKEISFTKPEITLLKELLPALEPLGFNLAFKDLETLSVIGIPVAITELVLEKVLQDFLNAYQNGADGPHFSQTDILAKALAKSMSVKTGEPLSLNAQQHMINELFACKEPMRSPFGKIVYNTIQETELDLKFL